MQYLNHIKEAADVKELDAEQRRVLAQEMRDALLKKLSVHGGHFGPNFGMVEATIALHYVFDSPRDKMVFDVSHQSYCHKMLTGRKDAFLYEEQYDDVSGYSEPDESAHDIFTIGHTSTSISLACGLAKARDQKGGSENIIAIIGDGSLSGGEALEGLDFAYELHSNLIIVVNDNDMSIAENHGGLYRNLKLLRETNGQAECNLFKAMGLDYRYVSEGNDIDALIAAFEQVKGIDHPVVVHICTQKGKGYAPAEADKENWHWCMPFDVETGMPTVDFSGMESYENLAADLLMKKMEQDPSVVAISSATPTVIGFTKEKREQAGAQFVDVGIAEEHAVAFASGIAAGGCKPVYGVYSTFLQRTFDQLSQDVCINNSPVTILVYAASVFGMNDVTHLGIYDIPMVSNIPNMVYLAPTCREEFEAMTEWAIEQREHPVAVRVPANGVIRSGRTVQQDYGELNRYQVTQQGSRVAVLALGTFYQLGEQAAEQIKKVCGMDVTLINPRYITGVDEALLEQLKAAHELVITLEDGILDGGFGEKIARFYGASAMKVVNYGLKKEFLDRYDPAEILKYNHLTPEQIAEDVRVILG
ncbi:MAG: 1-deoxy-D-xylulose-5-phosphate synthase [Butyricicoccaceae bacterium]